MVISDMVYHYLNLLLIDNNDKQNDSFWIYVKFLDTKRLSFFAQQPFMDCSTSQVDCQSEKIL